MPSLALFYRRSAIRSLALRLRQVITGRLEQRRNTLEGRAQMLASLSYQSVLKRGFAVVRDDAGRTIRSAARITPAMALEIELADGRVTATADGTGSGDVSQSQQPAGEAKPAARPTRSRPAGGGQGTLL